MSDNPYHERVIALSALFQACKVVEVLAKTGSAKEDLIEPLYQGVFALNPDTTEDVYGGVRALRPGMQLLWEILTGDRSLQHRDCIRYVLGVMHLQKKLAREEDMMAIIRNRLEHSERHSAHFDEELEIARLSRVLAGIYQDTASKLSYRIKVTGAMSHLQNTDVADRIRALLLSAIRSAMLWRQLGGNRWQMLFSKGKIQKALAHHLQHTTPT